MDEGRGMMYGNEWIRFTTGYLLFEVRMESPLSIFRGRPERG